MIGREWAWYEQEEVMTGTYHEVLEHVMEILEEDRVLHEQLGKNFYYNTFFKRPKSRIDYNRKANIIESETLIEDLQQA